MYSLLSTGFGESFQPCPFLGNFHFHLGYHLCRQFFTFCLAVSVYFVWVLQKNHRFLMETVIFSFSDLIFEGQKALPGLCPYYFAAWMYRVSMVATSALVA